VLQFNFVAFLAEDLFFGGHFLVGPALSGLYNSYINDLTHYIPLDIVFPIVQTQSYQSWKRVFQTAWIYIYTGCNKFILQANDENVTHKNDNLYLKLRLIGVLQART